MNGFKQKSRRRDNGEVDINAYIYIRFVWKLVFEVLILSVIAKRNVALKDLVWIYFQGDKILEMSIFLLINLW